MAQQSADNYARLQKKETDPPVIELSSVDSTNNYALNLLRQHSLTERQEDAKHGLAIFAHEQYAGKGQRGKTWHSDKGENIHLSIIIEPKQFLLKQQFKLNAIIAIAVKTFFERHAQSDITIKWPNDIYFKDRKAGGILIENIISGREWKWAVAGIGLNINQVAFEEGLTRKPVSLKQITGKTFNCFELAKELQREILYGFEAPVAENITDAYNQILYKRGEKVLFDKAGQKFEAIVKEVLPTGQLALQAAELLYFDFGEISWII